MKTTLAVLALFLAACATAPPPAATPRPEPIPLDSSVVHGKLENGLTYYIRPNKRPEKRAALRLAVNAGSVLEDDDQKGIAHLVEHMAFNGTRNFEKQELVNYLQRIGMRFGPDVNAYTSFDETVYMLEVPTDDPKIVETAFRILEDWAQEVSFDTAEVDKERGVVIEEWRLGRGFSGRIRDKQFPILFHGSRYAERLPIGEKETLQSVSRDTLVRYYKEWYRPDLMAVVAVGDFDPAAIEALVKKHFGPLPASQRARERKQFEVPDHPQTLISIVTDPEATSSDVRVQYKRPRQHTETADDYRKRLVDWLYDGMMIDRLRELTTKADPPFQSGFAASGPLTRTKSAYTLGARVRDGGIERGLAALLTEARRVEKHGFTATELERTKTEILRSIEQAWLERDKQMSARLAGQYVNHFLTGDPAPSIEYTRELVNRFIPGITLAEVNARAGQWLTKENRVILVSGPSKKEARIPDETTVLSVFKNADQLEVTPWVDQVRNEPLVSQVPKAGSVIEESVVAEIGMTRWRLSNGVTVLLKPTDFKNDEILLRGYSPGGHSLVSDSDYIAASQAAAIASDMGTGNFNRTELEKALAGKVVSARTFISELSEGVSGSSSGKDFETMLQLIYLRLTGARKDPEAFQAYLSRMRASLENQQASPSYHFSRRFTEVITKDHVRRRFLEPSDLTSLSLDRALSIYNDRFSDASDFTFTIVGSFRLAEIRPAVERWLGSLPARRRGETWRNVGVSQPEGVAKFEVRKGVEAKSSVRMTFHGHSPWSLEKQHLLSSLAELLQMRLRDELREEKGGVYGVGVSGSIYRWPEEEYAFTINFGCDPARVDELVAVVFKEIEKVKNDPGADYVQKVREIQTRQRETVLKENAFWTFNLEYHVTNQVDPREILRYADRVASVTTESMKETARAFLNNERYVLGVLVPEKVN